jgi:hypothetical protein
MKNLTQSTLVASVVFGGIALLTLGIDALPAAGHSGHAAAADRPYVTVPDRTRGPVDSPAADTQAPASLAGDAIDPATGNPIWWSFAGQLPSPSGGFAKAALANSDTECPSKQECPDPRAP